MKVELKDMPSSITTAANTNVGDVMIYLGNESSYLGDTILHIYDGFVSLEHPNATWDEQATFNVMTLPKGTQIELTVE